MTHNACSIDRGHIVRNITLLFYYFYLKKNMTYWSNNLIIAKTNKGTSIR